MKESQNTEFKQSWHDEYLKWICGFANAKGGTLYIGIEGKTKRVLDERAVLAAYGLKPDTPKPEIVAHLFGLYAKATEGTKRTEGTKETKETEATKEGDQSLRSLPSLSSLEGGSNG